MLNFGPIILFMHFFLLNLNSAISAICRPLRPHCGEVPGRDSNPGWAM